MGTWVIGLAVTILMIIVIGIVGILIFVKRNRGKKSAANITLIIIFGFIFLYGIYLLFGNYVESLLKYADIKSVEVEVENIDDDTLNIIVKFPNAIWHYEGIDVIGHGDTHEEDIYIERSLGGSKETNYEFKYKIGTMNAIYLCDYWGHRKLIWSR